MAFSSTFATRGSALGIVVETAEQTEIGKIAVLMKEIQGAAHTIAVEDRRFHPHTDHRNSVNRDR